jgi:hypothetical protein
MERYSPNIYLILTTLNTATLLYNQAYDCRFI